MKSDYKIQPNTQVKNFIKKIKDKQLKELFVRKIYHEIAQSPYEVGEQKTGDLSNVWVANLRYQKTEYRIAYVIQEEKIVPFLLAGTHEGFYEQLKRMK